MSCGRRLQILTTASPNARQTSSLVTPASAMATSLEKANSHQRTENAAVPFRKAVARRAAVWAARRTRSENEVRVYQRGCVHLDVEVGDQVAVDVAFEEAAVEAELPGSEGGDEIMVADEM